MKKEMEEASFDEWISGVSNRDLVAMLGKDTIVATIDDDVLVEMYDRKTLIESFKTDLKQMFKDDR